MHKVGVLLRHSPDSVIRLIRLVLFLGALLPSVAHADFCAVTVKVSLPDGSPINSTWIELVDNSGRIVRRESVGSEFQICDFGFGPHTLRVGTNECLPISISNLRVVIDKPLHLNVVMQPCFYGHVTRSDCLVYFRTVDSAQQPLPNVDLSPRLNADKPARTDSFGRWQGVFRGDFDINFTKPGYEPATASIHCKEDEEVDVEVVMLRDGEQKPR